MVKLSSSSTVTLGNHWNAMEVGEKSEGRKRTSAHTSLHLGFVSCVCSFSFLSYSFISQQINKRVSACVLFVPYRSRLLLIVWIEWLRGEKTQLNSASITRRYGQTWRTWARDSGPCFAHAFHSLTRFSFLSYLPFLPSFLLVGFVRAFHSPLERNTTRKGRKRSEPLDLNPARPYHSRWPNLLLVPDHSRLVLLKMWLDCRMPTNPKPMIQLVQMP